MRASAYQPEFGLLGAGAVSAGLVGRLFAAGRTLGPVAGVSYRVASRIANGLGSGTPVRSADELDRARTILFFSPPSQQRPLLDILENAGIQWIGKSLIFCDCQPGHSLEARFLGRGASLASIRECPLPGRLVISGAAPALRTARGLARGLSMKPIELGYECEDLFQAALTLGTAALTPLIDLAADLLRKCGVRDSEAPVLAAALFQQTTREYSHSGRQSWAWHAREPEPRELETETTFLRDLMLLGFDRFDKHPDAARALRSRPGEAGPIPDAAPAPDQSSTPSTPESNPPPEP